MCAENIWQRKIISIYIFDLCIIKGLKVKFDEKLIFRVGSRKIENPREKVFFHQILLFIGYHTQIEYLGSFIPHDRVLNTPVAYDLYFNHKQLLELQKLILIYH